MKESDFIAMREGNFSDYSTGEVLAVIIINELQTNCELDILEDAALENTIASNTGTYNPNSEKALYNSVLQVLALGASGDKTKLMTLLKRCPIKQAKKLSHKWYIVHNTGVREQVSKGDYWSSGDTLPKGSHGKVRTFIGGKEIFTSEKNVKEMTRDEFENTYMAGVACGDVQRAELFNVHPLKSKGHQAHTSYSAPIPEHENKGELNNPLDKDSYERDSFGDIIIKKDEK